MLDCFDDAPPLIYDYLLYLSAVRNKSLSTVNEYYLDLRTFFRYLKLQRKLVDKNVEFEQITISDVELDLIKSVTLDDAYKFMLYVKQERSNSAVTRCRKISSIVSFYKYLTNRKMVLSVNPIEGLERPKMGKRLPKYLTLEQCYQLLGSVEGKFKERDYCILVLFLNCGMRLSELCSIDCNSIQGDHLRIIGKGDKERRVYLNKACLDAIDAYMKVRPNTCTNDRNALFISRQNNRLSTKSVQAMVNKYLDKIGLANQGYSVHKLRHTAATLMYQHGGVDIRILQEVLGHENLATTEIYTHVANSQVDDAMSANPLAQLKIKDKNDGE